MQVEEVEAQNAMLGDMQVEVVRASCLPMAAVVAILSAIDRSLFVLFFFFARSCSLAGPYFRQKLQRENMPIFSFIFC
jgi:hypothetical protein